MRRRHSGTRVFGVEQFDVSLKAGLVGHWTGGGAGRGWLDRSGYGNHGTFVGAPKWTLGFDSYRDAIRTAASTDQVSCGTAVMATDLGTMTVSAWVYTTDEGNEQQIISKLKADNTAGWVFVIDAGGTLTFYAQCSGGDAFVTTTPTLATNRWYHVAYTQTAMVSGSPVVYINGVSAAFGASSNGAPTYKTDAAANLSIAGRDFDTAGLIGSIDDVRLYNRALARPEIVRLAQPGQGLVMAAGRRHASQSTFLVTNVINRSQAVNRSNTY